MLSSLMKIESLTYYNESGHYQDNVVDWSPYHRDFGSIHEIACFIRQHLFDMCLWAAIVWLDNGRFVYIRKDAYEVHYHARFN